MHRPQPKPDETLHEEAEAEAEGQGTELIYRPPEQPFYINNPPWLPADNKLYWVAVFYLTNNLTEQQNQAILN